MPLVPLVTVTPEPSLGFAGEAPPAEPEPAQLVTISPIGSLANVQAVAQGGAAPPAPRRSSQASWERIA